MEDRKRTVFAVVIACIVLISLIYSFGLNFFNRYPELILAQPSATVTPDQSGGSTGDVGGIPVEVTPQTVQSVIADLERYESYSRTISVVYYGAQDRMGELSAQVWADGGWVRTSVSLSSGTTEHCIIGNGEYWLWYDREALVHHGAAGQSTADLMQRLPTYEDVLALDPSEITAARFELWESQPCIFVEFSQPKLNYVYRYWVSVNNGLLVASETVREGELLYSMSSREVVSPLTEKEGIFVLPDTTVLHE